MKIKEYAVERIKDTKEFLKRDVIFEVVKDIKGSEAVCVGNILKYVMRARKKK